MNFSQRLTFLFSAPMFDADDLEGLRVSQIIAAIERMGFQVIKARRLEDAEIAVQTDAAIGCMVVDWGKKGIEGKAASLINLMRKRGLDMPIVVLIRRKRFEDIPVEVLDFIDGYVFLAEETPEFIARNLVSRLKQYADTLKTPFFGALVDYQEEGNQLWTCPGHNGGVFYSRSPIGRIFVEHLGEANFIYVTLQNGQDVVVRGDGNNTVRIGENIILSAASSAFHVFDANGQALRRVKPGNMISSKQNAQSR